MKKQSLLACVFFILLTAVYLSPVQAQDNPLQTDSAPALHHQFASTSVGIHTASIAWKPASETGILSFELQRSTDSISFIPVLLMQAKGTIKKPNGYSYLDTELLATRYFYRLYIQNFDGQETYSPILRVDLKDSDTSQMETARL